MDAPFAAANLCMFVHVSNLTPSGEDHGPKTEPIMDSASSVEIETMPSREMDSRRLDSSMHDCMPSAQNAKEPMSKFAVTSAEVRPLTSRTAKFVAGYVHDGIDDKVVSYAPLKRGLDIIVALIGLLVFSPVMVVAAILVKFTSRGPIIFRQVRVGKGGRCFTCFKFRSMCADAEERRHSIRHLNELDGPVFKIKHDPRFTPIGGIIRKSSIDELPQLFNVLKGEMSIVGPRPPIPMEVETYTARERRRLAVQPGLTCLWQVNGRSTIPFERWIELDMEYIETMSFLGDVRIILATIPAVLTGRGAH